MSSHKRDSNTAVVVDGRDDEVFAVNFTGVFAPHSMCLLHNKLLLFMLLATLLQNYISCNANTVLTSSPASPIYECGSIDIRNDCSSLLQLKNCTVIKGYLMIVLLPRLLASNNNNNTTTLETCDYGNYTFPLVEITDYLIFFDVRGLSLIRDMFPSLTVIRGRRLFLNYALGITTMPDLEMIEFRSLVQIQRGHVFIGNCPKLCHLEKIYWDRLTTSSGENHIYPVAPETCTSKSECIGCSSKYCWSNVVCQKFQNDNVIDAREGLHHCHEECLGGCYNSTQEGCVVCKGLTDHGTCVNQCPENKFLLEHHQRCYTRQECIDMHMYMYELTCVSECPSGFIPDKNTSECVPCSEGVSCIKICQPPLHDEPIIIFNLADADHLKGCEVLNGSLIITIRNVINNDDLLDSLGSISEIRGHLKIYRSPFLTSLNFLKNLRKIQGDPLENGLYALILYDNANLNKLWDPENFELKRGSIYVHSNNKLCNRLLREFREKVVHDKTLDSLQTNDQEVLCGPAKIMLQIEILSHHSIQLIWPKEQTLDEVEIIYRPIPYDKESKFSEETELDSNVCTRINWQRQIVFSSELTLSTDHSHHSFTITGLEQNTKYGCLVKTFESDDDKLDARSVIKYVRTKIDIPTPPKINLAKKTDNSMTLQIKQGNHTSSQVITHYLLKVYELEDNLELLDKRNYCDQPALLYQDMQVEAYSSASSHNENYDYDDCCTLLLEEAEDLVFVQRMRDEFSCSLDRRENCEAMIEDINHDDKPIQSFKIYSNESTHTIHHLERFRLYSLQLSACNDIGCGSFSMHSERTNYSASGDKLDNLRACRAPDTHEYHVSFSEPKHPNGQIVSYVIHYRIYLPNAEVFQSHINCVTRLQHEVANFQHSAKLNASFNEVAVRVHSLAGDVLTHWVNVTQCQPGSVTKLAGISANDSRHSHSLNIFLIFFLIGAGGTILWICYKRRYWRKLSEMRRYLPLHNNWRSLIEHRSDDSLEDRQVLVDGFETVRFHNNPDDDQKYLE